MRNIDNIVNSFLELVLISLCILFDQQFVRLLVLIISYQRSFYVGEAYFEYFIADSHIRICKLILTLLLNY